MTKREELNTKIWGLIVSYGAATSLHDEALRIDVGVRKAAETCDGIEDELRQALAALASAPSDPQAEPIYQIRKAFADDPEGTWRDASREAHGMHAPGMRRIVYGASDRAPVVRTLRDEFAMAALCMLGAAAHEEGITSLEDRAADTARACFTIADAFMKARIA